MNDKELMKKLYMTINEEIAIEEFRKSLVPTPLEMLKEEVENSVKRKKRLMRLEKEKLVDMVFDLESRNEMLVNNLIKVEDMYNKLKEEVENG